MGYSVGRQLVGTFSHRCVGAIDVPQYRIYFIDYRGHYSAVEKFEADSDNAAIAATETLREGEDVELWNEVRAIARLSGKKRIPKLP
jgi:hypothetical protein